VKSAEIKQLCMMGALEVYMNNGHKKVEGWLTKIALKAIAEISGIQNSENINGPVCEIGVHHGRLFILLHLLTNEPERSVAWDIFENQNENIDQSGHGDIDALKANLNRFGCDLNRIKIITENSLNLEPEAIISACNGKPRLFSIDGGHTAEITCNDLSLAAQTICKNGIIILDDVFNEAWPGVAEGTCRYMIENPGVHPILIAGNKVMFTDSEKSAQMYKNRLNFTYPGYIRKDSVFFDNDVICYTPINTNFAWKHLRDTSAGKLLKKLLKR
jgi:hypothetical protein